MSVTLVLVLSALAWQIQTKGSQIVQAVAERELNALGSFYGGEVQAFINHPLGIAMEIAKVIASMEEEDTALTRGQIIGILTHTNSDIIASSRVSFLPRPEDVSFKNRLGSDANGQFTAYVNLDGLQLMNKEMTFTAPYYLIPQTKLIPHASAPYQWTEPSGKVVLMSSIGAPIVENGTFIGAVMVDFSLEAMAKKIHDMKFYETGAVAVATQAGNFVTHPNPELTLKNIFEIEIWRNDQNLQLAFQAGEPYLAVAMVGEIETVYYFSPTISSQTGQIMYTILIVPLEELLADVAQLTKLTLIASVIALIVLLSVIVIGVRSSVKPLATIVETAKRVSSGDYNTVTDTSNFGGEILELNDAISAMIESLVENISKAEAMSKDAQEQSAKAQVAMQAADVARITAEAQREDILTAADQLEIVVGIIYDASQELSIQIEASERGFEVQAIRVCDTATAMEEMNCTVLEVARSASEAAQISIEARAKAELGAQVVESAMTGVQRVQKVSLALKGDMNTLAKKAGAITTIMNMISDIADQTNLLALNAAIEAARAGEAGRGFAVVADEVKKLAEKTVISTTDVGNAIQSIQSSVSVSISQVDQAVELIASVVEQAGESGRALAEIVSLMDTTSGQVQSIATASEEQSATSEEINRSISEINDVAVNSTESIHKSVSVVSRLVAQVDALNSLIEGMKKA